MWRNRSANKGALLVPIGIPKTEFPSQVKVNTGAKLPTRDVSVSFARPESAKVIGSNEALSSGVKDPFQ